MMENRSARLNRIRILAWMLTVLSLAILLVSAYIRLKGAGLGCSPWPHCYGQLLAGTATLQNETARILHRSVASLALVLGFILVAQCLRPQPIQPSARIATALLSLMIVLTFVGLFSADPHRVWPGFVNILGGAGLVMLSWYSVLATRTGPPQLNARRPPALLHAGAALLVLTMALGALIGVRYAAIACPTLPGCSGVFWPAAAGWSALDYFAGIVAPAGLGDDGGVALHLLHRYCALATFLLLGVGGLQALAQPVARFSAGLLLVLLLIQPALGVLTLLSGFSLWLAIGHSIGAALLLAATVHLLARPAG